MRRLRALADSIVLAGSAAVEKAANDAGFDVEVPFTGMAASPSGEGYWLVAADGQEQLVLGRRQPGIPCVAHAQEVEREHDRQRRHEQHERRRRRDRNVEDRLERGRARGWIARLVRERTDDAPTFVDQIRRDERREEHALRPDESPDSDLAAIEPRRRVMMPVRASFDMIERR